METKKNVEANALTPISADERQGWVSLAFVQAGICVCASSFWEGAILAESMPLWEAILYTIRLHRLSDCRNSDVHSGNARQ